MRLKHSKFRSNSGFTLLELLTVILIVGVLAALCAPSWLRFHSQQQLSVGQSQITEILRQGQSQAKREHRSYEVNFTQPNGDSKVQWETRPVSSSQNTQRYWNSLHADVVLDPGTTLYQKDHIYRVRFDHQGAIEGQLGRLTLSARNDRSMKRCVIVSSLLAAMRNGESKTATADSACD